MTCWVMPQECFNFILVTFGHVYEFVVLGNVNQTKFNLSYPMLT